ncbi:patatin-like phospholipase family protein [Algibacter pacificus]|uniref:patatin-like phospholipase family protein n=1 Tax=Algibacter pacificus TaxID=2599389 RepID=UPI0011CAFFF1|nr:patatin-like phospholipase family protein [Algibacter pacificus]
MLKNNRDKLYRLDKNSPINLVLSGGGMKCAAHLALLEKIEALGLKINAISGSSGGALVAALYASGLSTQEILEIFKNTSLFKFSYLSIVKAGLFDTFLFKSIIENKIKNKFGALNLPIYVTASNMQTGKPRYFCKGKLLKPVLASCAIPGIFSPISINKVLYSDGGILDNFPIQPFIKSGLPIIGSYVSEPAVKTPEQLNTTLKVVAHASYLRAHSAESFKFNFTKVTISFPLSHYSGLDNKEAEKIYKASKDYLDDFSI